jgi:hypothetical protein
MGHHRYVVNWFASSLVAAVLVSLAGAPTSAVETSEKRGADRGGGRFTDLQHLRAASKAGPAVRAPRGPNPYLALLPDPSRADYTGWRAYMQAKGVGRAAVLARRDRAAGLLPPLAVRERERAHARGVNDRRATAQRIPRFGSAPGQSFRTRITGRLSPEVVPARRVKPSREDDGSIRRARATGLPALRKGIRTNGRIGDGPLGRAGDGSGDFDFYKVRVPAGQRLVVRVRTPKGRLDPMVAVFSARGRVVGFNDDHNGRDSFVSQTIRKRGVYTVMVSGFFSVPRNPFRSGSGRGAASEGPYRMRIRVGQDDRDLFAVRLRAGDVLGASTSGGAARLTVYDPHGVEVKGSTQDASIAYPAQSPLPGGGRAVVDHVAAEDGLHYVAVSDGAGAYGVTVETYRPALEGDPVTQTLFLDFNGARVNTVIWGGPGVRQLAPLRDFLPRWGMRPQALNPLIDAIIAEVQENVQADLVASGLADNFRIEIRNSRDDGELFGGQNVSRIIVGGTIRQSGVPTIGVAQSIDPGNFATEESAVVLLDSLSEERGPAFSLNTWLRRQSNRVPFVGQAVGNVVSHEAGHFFGDWHVDQFNGKANLMDQGGAFRLMYGVGRDGVGGTADDPDVDFGPDRFNPDEGFTGLEDTLSRLATVIIS